MAAYRNRRSFKTFTRTVSVLVIFTFVFGSLSPRSSYAQVIPQTILNLPAAGTLIARSSVYTPVIVTGITIHPDNPLQFDFIINTGDDNLQGEALQKESQKLVRYFMASLTVPEDEMWVNLSPYEKNRIIADGLGQTDMGVDMLAQDYLLKQLTASLIYPEDELGKEFWKRVYKLAWDKYTTTEIPMDTFNKVWIVPDKASVYVHGTSAFVVGSHLKVMMEQDYVALNKNKDNAESQVIASDDRGISTISSQIIRELIIPELEREVNTGKNFANLRQIYHSMILATWYKQNLKESFLGQVYMDQNKVDGIDIDDKEMKQKVYDRYLEAYKKGVYNFIKEDFDESSQQMIPRKYFSGGVALDKIGRVNPVTALPAGWLAQEQRQPHVTGGVRLDGLGGGTTDSDEGIQITGRHFSPGFPAGSFQQGRALRPDDIKYIRDRVRHTNGEVRGLLEEAQKNGVELSITGHLRGVDGPGSSLDLPEFQKALTDIGVADFDNLPSTPTIASKFTAKVRFEKTDNPGEVIYVAPDYGITEDNPLIFSSDVTLTQNGRTPKEQRDAPGYIFRNIFGLSGVKITLESISPMALAGGMESSNIFNTALIAAASMLSGADLSEAEIFNLAVKLENDEFGGLTGGQGHLSTLLGGAYRHIWTSGVKDAGGNFVNPYSAVSVPLLSDDALDSIENHMMLVQAGKNYVNGKAEVARTAALINYMWTDLLRDNDEVGFPLHKEKLGLTAQYTKALKEGDFKTVAQVTIRYVEIRDALVKRWLSLMLDARNGLAVPEYAKTYAAKVFDSKHAEYKDYQVIRDIYQGQGGEAALRSSRLYTLGPIADLVEKAKAQGIAVMPLGAGGPGANLIVIDPQGTEHLRDFLKAQGLENIDEDKAREVIRGTGTLKGFMKFEVGREPMQFAGFNTLSGVKALELPGLKTMAGADVNLESNRTTGLAGGTTESDTGIQAPRVLQKKDIPTFKSIAERALWLSTRMIDEANLSKNKEDVGVGGHQAAAASSLHIILALELFAMNGQDFVAHKPHSGPVYHAIQYLLGNLPEEALYRLRENAISPDYSVRLQQAFNALPQAAQAAFKDFQEELLKDLPETAKTDLKKIGLHSYPGMADSDGVLVPTGSVGLGPAATIGLAVAQKWMRDHGYKVPDAHYYAVVGDSEFGEGNYQEILPLAQQFGLDNVTHIVDYNRQSLDGNTQGWRLQNIKDRYAANGWKVIELKWGRKIKTAFRRKNGGQMFKKVMDELPQEEYQDATAKNGKEIRDYLVSKNSLLQGFLQQYDDDQVYELFIDLGGHDLQELTSALKEAKESKQAVAIIAHTIKGWGLKPMIGKPGNHSQRLQPQELAQLQKELGISDDKPFPNFQDKPTEKSVFDALSARLQKDRGAAQEILRTNSNAQAELGSAQLPQRITPSAPAGLMNVSSQVWFGYIISKLRGIAQKPEAELTDEERVWLPIAKRIVTISPDVATSTGVGKKGKLIGYSPENPADTHIRVGIEEMNAVTLGAAIGKMKDFMGQPMLPIVTIYDMFLFRRALDPAFYAQYWNSRLMLVGTPGGSTLSPEGAQHQSNIEPVIAGNLPNFIGWDPAFAVELEYIMAEEFKRTLANDYEGRNVVYLRGTTLDQDRKELPKRLAQQKRFAGQDISEKNMPQEWQEDMLKGGYRLVDYTGYENYDPNENVVNIVTAGAMVKEALKASDKLLEQGIYANVIVVTSSSLLHGNLGRKDDYQHLKKLIPVSETIFTPTIAVADAAPDYLAQIGNIVGLNLGMGVLALRKNGVSTRGTARTYVHQGISFVNIAETAQAELDRRDMDLDGKVEATMDALGIPKISKGTTDSDTGVIPPELLQSANALLEKNRARSALQESIHGGILLKRIEANDKSGVQNMLSTLQRKLDERDKGVVKFDTVSHLERLLLVHFSDLEEKVVYYGDIALLSYLLKEETLPVLLKALANGQLTDEARRKGLVAAQKHEAFRGIEETVLRQELEIAYANLPIIIDDIVKDGKNILITLIEVKARRARARWMRGMVSQSDDPELVSGVIDWAMKKAGTTFTDSRAELARLLGVSSSLLKEIFSEFDIHTNPTRGRPTTDSDTGVGAPLKPLRFATYLAPAWKIATIKGHDYSVFRLPDQSQVILKYFKRIVAGAWQIPTSALNSRAAYELSHFLGFSRINASQIYAEEEGSFGAVEEYWGNSDLAEESFGSELSKAVDVVTALRSQADNYGQYVKIFGKSLVEGDVYRLFANHYDDSYKPTNIRVGVDAQGNPEIRWIDHDGAFAPDFSDEPLTQDQVLTYLKHRSAFIKEYASELVDKIAQLSDSDIEKISENVYGDETRGLLRNKMFENGASESEVQRTLQSLERFRMIFIRQAKERRETFSKFLAWTKEEAPGGIDFNAKMMDMKVGGEAQKIRFTVPRGTLPNINVNGFSPVIINITPVPNFMLLLGLSTEKQPQQVSSLN